MNATMEQVNEKSATAALLLRMIVIDGANEYPPKYPDNKSPYACVRISSGTTSEIAAKEILR
jgi:hypothetical protein